MERTINNNFLLCIRIYKYFLELLAKNIAEVVKKSDVKFT